MAGDGIDLDFEHLSSHTGAVLQQQRLVVGKLIVPTKIKNIIEIVDTNANPNWYEEYCDITQMPAYWVGPHNTHAPPDIDYKALLTRKICRDTIIY